MKRNLIVCDRCKAQSDVSESVDWKHLFLDYLEKCHDARRGYRDGKVAMDLCPRCAARIVEVLRSKETEPC